MVYFSVISHPITGSAESIQEFLNVIFCIKEIFNENARVSALQRKATLIVLARASGSIPVMTFESRAATVVQ